MNETWCTGVSEGCRFQGLEAGRCDFFFQKAFWQQPIVSGYARTKIAGGLYSEKGQYPTVGTTKCPACMLLELFAPQLLDACPQDHFSSTT